MLRALLADGTQFAHRRARLGMDFVKANRAAVEKAIRDKEVELDLEALLALFAAGPVSPPPLDRIVPVP